MTDRWARAEERFRQQEAERRYRRDDRAWGDDDATGSRHAAQDPDDDYEYDDETRVIPRYTDEGRTAAPRARVAHPTAPPPRQAAYTDDDYADDDRYDDDRYDDDGYDDYDDDPYPSDTYDSGAYAPVADRGRAARAEAYDERDEGYDDPPPARPAQARRARAAAASTGGARPRRTEASADRPSRGRRDKRSRAAARQAEVRDKRRRRRTWIIVAVVALLALGGGAYAVKRFAASMSGPEDYAGPGGALVVVRVQPGDTAKQIAQSMVDKDVVKSSGAFYEAAVRNTGMNAVQPGYYAIPSQVPAELAVTTLLGKGSRVGNLVVSEGRLLHDQHDVNTGARKEGIYTKIAAASCVGTGPQQKCVSAQDLAAAGAGSDLAALGVPTWAMDSVRALPDRERQLEGLIAAGTWDFDPSAGPREILAQLVSASAAGYESTGLLQSGANTKLTPYETLIAASLVEREALPQDMPKVARVIVNRLEVGQQLQFDSTVNYALDTTEVATTDADRSTVTPWNTYAMEGLPANPIAAPSLNALRAMENPEPGPWLYFVTIDMKGTTLFTESYSQHLRNIDKAHESGILDSGR